MTEEKRALLAALNEISIIKKRDGSKLDLGFSQFSALKIIPAEILEIPHIDELELDNTQIVDLSPIRSLDCLERLHMNNVPASDLSPISTLERLEILDIEGTNVRDIEVIRKFKNLRALNISNTHVSDISPVSATINLEHFACENSAVQDLRPLTSLSKLGTDGWPGLHFEGCKATQRDQMLDRLSRIDDTHERTRETLAYLRSLPPWPEPYTPAATPDGSPPQLIGDMPAAPDPDRVPHLVLGPDNRVDLPPVLPTEAELADPIRERLYQRLPAALDGLLRYSNRYPELDSPARALREMVDAPFDQADFLLIHLEIDALTDIRDSQNNRTEAEKLDVDCLAALAGVLRIAPPITMGHPDIDLLEERGRAYQRSRIPENVAAAESRIARGLDQHVLATERTQEFARRTAAAGETGRVAETRRGFTKNVVLIMYFITEQATSAAYGHVFGTPTVAAAQFLLTHKDAILATAPSWGQSGFAWAQYVMIHAQRIIDEARKPD